MKTLSALSPELLVLCTIPQQICSTKKEDEELPANIWKQPSNDKFCDRTPPHTGALQEIFLIAETVRPPAVGFLEKRMRTYPKIPPRKIVGGSQINNKKPF